MTISSKPTQNHPWLQTSPRVYTQTYDSYQTVLKNFKLDQPESDRDILPFTSYIKLKSPLPLLDIETRLRNAWKTARYHNPGLAIELGQHYKTYRAPSLEDVELWLWTTFRIHNQDTCARDVTQRPQHVSRPVLHWFPGTKELLLICHHFYFDARSAWRFWDMLLDKVIEPEHITNPGDEVGNLPLARDDLLGLPSYPAFPSFIKAHEMVAGPFKEDVILLPVLNKQDDEFNAAVSHLDNYGQLRETLSEEQTADIVTACKKRGISVTAAFYAALAQACQSLQAQHGRSGRYALCFHHFDARPWYKQRQTDTDGRGRNNLGFDHHAIIPFALDLEREKIYADLVLTVDKFFKTTRADFTTDPSGLDAINYLLSSVLTPRAQLPSAPFFSSYGVAEKQMKSLYGQKEIGTWVEVEDLYNAVPMPGAVSEVFIWTFRGRFNVFAGFHELYHSGKTFEGLIRDTCRRMLCGLGVENREEVLGVDMR